MASEQEIRALTAAESVFNYKNDTYPHENNILYGNFPSFNIGKITSAETKQIREIDWGVRSNGTIYPNFSRVEVYYNKNAIPTANYEITEKIHPVVYGMTNRVADNKNVAHIASNYTKGTQTYVPVSGVDFSVICGYKKDGNDSSFYPKFQTDVNIDCLKTYFDVWAPYVGSTVRYRSVDPRGNFYCVCVASGSDANPKSATVSNYFYEDGGLDNGTWKYTMTYYVPTGSMGLTTGNAPVGDWVSGVDSSGDGAYKMISGGEGKLFSDTTVGRPISGFLLRSAAQPTQENQSSRFYLDWLIPSVMADKICNIWFGGSFLYPLNSASTGINLVDEEVSESIHRITGIGGTMNLYNCDKTTFVVYTTADVQYTLSGGEKVTDSAVYGPIVLPSYRFQYEYGRVDDFGTRVKYIGKTPVSVNVPSDKSAAVSNVLDSAKINDWAVTQSDFDKLKDILDLNDFFVFNKAAGYNKGDYVVLPISTTDNPIPEGLQKTLWICTANGGSTAGVWADVSERWKNLEFDSSTNYSAGDYVSHESVAYECISGATAGAWDLSKWNRLGQVKLSDVTRFEEWPVVSGTAQTPNQKWRIWGEDNEKLSFIDVETELTATSGTFHATGPVKLFKQGKLYGFDKSALDNPQSKTDSGARLTNGSIIGSVSPYDSIYGNKHKKICPVSIAAPIDACRNLFDVKSIDVNYLESTITTHEQASEVEIDLDVNWFGKDMLVTPCRGRLDFISLKAAKIRGYYLDDDGVVDSVTVNSSTGSLWANRKHNGKQETLFKASLVYNQIGTNILSNDFVLISELYRTMVGEDQMNTEGLSTYFTPSDSGPEYGISGYALYGGGMFEAVTTTGTKDDTASAHYDIENRDGIETLTYHVYDTVSVDAHVEGALSQTIIDDITRLVGQEAAKGIKLKLPTGAKSVWFAYLKKSGNANVDSSIKLDILDAHGAIDSDSTKNSWEKMNISDVTEYLKGSDGKYFDPFDNPNDATAFKTGQLRKMLVESETNYYDTKIRFSLYVDDDDGWFLNENGYTVVVGYAIIDSFLNNSSIKLFKVFEKKYNPYSKLMNRVPADSYPATSGHLPDRTYDFFVSESANGVYRTDLENTVFGTVFLPCPSNVDKINKSGVSAEIIYEDTISGDTTIGRLAENPSYTSIDVYRMANGASVNELSANNTYYVQKDVFYPSTGDATYKVYYPGGGIWLSANTYYDLHHRQGCYAIPIKNDEFYFRFDEGNYLQFAPEVTWLPASDGHCSGPYVENDPTNTIDKYNVSAETEIYMGASAKDYVYIYDIESLDGGMNCGSGSIYVSSHLTGDASISVKVGSRNAVDTIFRGDAGPTKIDFSYDRIEGSLEDESDVGDPVLDGRRIRVFLANGDGGSNDLIPERYYHLEKSSDGRYSYFSDYYEANGGFYIRFKPFESIPITTTEGPAIQYTMTRTPNLSASDIDNGYFYIVNRFKKFGMTNNLGIMWYHNGEVDSTHPAVTGKNKIIVGAYSTKWRASLRKGNDLSSANPPIWEYTPEQYVLTNNDTMALIQITCDDYGTEINSAKYGETDYSFTMSGDMSFYEQIYILRGNDTDAKLMRVFHTPYTGKYDAHNSFYPVKCIEPIYMTFNPSVIDLTDDPVVMNNTNNDENIYREYKMISDHDAYDWPIPADQPATTITNQVFTKNDSYIFTVKGYLTDAWCKNDEKLLEVVAVDSPTLTVLSRTAYDDEITRVLDGYKLRYPYQLNDILYPPNEWMTADNLNIRFNKIMEDLRYLKAQTKFYLPPPTMYGGYYGDYMTVLDGKSQRRFGYVPNGDLEVYRKTNEKQSIGDDETVLNHCNAMCTDTEDNLYACVGDDVLVCSTSKYASKIAEITPYKINEFIRNVNRIEFSEKTNLLYMLCQKTHKVYIFNTYKFSNRNTALNASYYGEIGGYGGKAAHSKFNNPTDLYISTVLSDPKDPSSEMIDEICVCDTGNSAVKRFSIKGQWLNTIDLSSTGEKIISVCTDYKNQVHVLTQKYVFTLTTEGEVINIFELKDKIKPPLMIRPQYAAGFLYVLYDHWVSKYSYDGYFVSRFAETEDLTYISMHANHNYDLFISTEKNILRYNDSLVLRELAVMENADKFLWKPEEYMLNKNENIQDAVINTAFQRIYDNIVMYAKCIFGRIIPLCSDNPDDRVADLDQTQQKRITDAIHKERIFVGINELVTVDVINRSFKQMYDLLEILLDSI